MSENEYKNKKVVVTINEVPVVVEELKSEKEEMAFRDELGTLCAMLDFECFMPWEVRP